MKEKPPPDSRRGFLYLPVDEISIPPVRRNVNLAKKYNQVAGTGLQLGLLKKEDADIDSYVARSALDGVYKIIGQEEKAIRANPAKAVGDLAKKVFGALGK